MDAIYNASSLSKFNKALNCNYTSQYVYVSLLKLVLNFSIDPTNQIEHYNVKQQQQQP